MLNDIINQFNEEEALIFTANANNAESKLAGLVHSIVEKETGLPSDNIREAVQFVSDLVGNIEDGVPEAEVLNTVGWFRAVKLIDAADSKENGLRFFVVPDLVKNGTSLEGYKFKLIIGNFLKNGKSNNRLLFADSIAEVEDKIETFYRPALLAAGKASNPLVLSPSSGYIKHYINTRVGQTANVERLHHYILVQLLPDLNRKLEVEERRNARVAAQFSAPPIDEVEEEDFLFGNGSGVLPEDAKTEESPVVEEFALVEYSSPEVEKEDILDPNAPEFVEREDKPKKLRGFFLGNRSKTLSEVEEAESAQHPDLDPLESPDTSDSEDEGETAESTYEESLIEAESPAETEDVNADVDDVNVDVDVEANNDVEAPAETEEAEADVEAPAETDDVKDDAPEETVNETEDADTEVSEGEDVDLVDESEPVDLENEVLDEDTEGTTEAAYGATSWDSFSDADTAVIPVISDPVVDLDEVHSKYNVTPSVDSVETDDTVEDDTVALDVSDIKESYDGKHRLEEDHNPFKFGF